jgi:hypothetical protein
MEDAEFMVSVEKYGAIWGAGPAFPILKETGCPTLVAPAVGATEWEYEDRVGIFRQLTQSGLPKNVRHSCIVGS